jgi:hypothetical protein
VDLLTEPPGSEGSSNVNQGTDGDASLSTEALAEQKAALEAEVERLRAEQAAAAKPKRRRLRKVAVGVLVVLTSISVLASTVGIWVHQTAFNTGKFVALMEPLAHDPQVQAQLGTYVTTQIFQAVDLQDKVHGALEAIVSALPPGTPAVSQLPVLAGPITAGAENAVRQRVTTYLRSAAFADLWSRILTTAHPKIVALLKGDYSATPNVQISGDTVYLNAVPVVAEILRSLVEKGLSLVGLNVTIPQISPQDVPQAAIDKLQSVLGVSLPANFGQIPIMSTANLHAAQQAVRTFDLLVWGLIALTIVPLVATLVLSLNRRRTLIQLAIGVTIALLVAGATIRLIRDQVVNSITNPGARGAAKDAIVTVLHSLRTTGAFVLVAAILVGLIAYLAGRPRWLMALVARIRAATAAGSNGSEVERIAAKRFDLLVVVGAALAAVLLFLVGFGWVSVIVIGALFGLWFWGLTVLRGRAQARVPEDAATAA